MSISRTKEEFLKGFKEVCTLNHREKSAASAKKFIDYLQTLQNDTVPIEPIMTAVLTMSESWLDADSFIYLIKFCPKDILVKVLEKNKTVLENVINRYGPIGSEAIYQKLLRHRRADIFYDSACKVFERSLAHSANSVDPMTLVKSLNPQVLSNLLSAESRTRNMAIFFILVKSQGFELLHTVFKKLNIFDRDRMLTMAFNNSIGVEFTFDGLVEENRRLNNDQKKQILELHKECDILTNPLKYYLKNKNQFITLMNDAIDIADLEQSRSWLKTMLPVVNHLEANRKNISSMEEETLERLHFICGTIHYRIYQDNNKLQEKKSELREIKSELPQLVLNDEEKRLMSFYRDAEAKKLALSEEKLREIHVVKTKLDAHQLKNKHNHLKEATLQYDYKKDDEPSENYALAMGHWLKVKSIISINKETNFLIGMELFGQGFTEKAINHFLAAHHAGHTEASNLLERMGFKKGSAEPTVSALSMFSGKDEKSHPKNPATMENLHKIRHEQFVKLTSDLSILLGKFEKSIASPALKKHLVNLNRSFERLSWIVGSTSFDTNYPLIQPLLSTMQDNLKELLRNKELGNNSHLIEMNNLINKYLIDTSSKKMLLAENQLINMNLEELNKHFTQMDLFEKTLTNIAQNKLICSQKEFSAEQAAKIVTGEDATVDMKMNARYIKDRHEQSLRVHEKLMASGEQLMGAVVHQDFSELQTVISNVLTHLKTLKFHFSKQPFLPNLLELKEGLANSISKIEEVLNKMAASTSNKSIKDSELKYEPALPLDAELTSPIIKELLGMRKMVVELEAILTPQKTEKQRTTHKMRK